jgi:FG-GAP-like repeat
MKRTLSDGRRGALALFAAIACTYEPALALPPGEPEPDPGAARRAYVLRECVPKAQKSFTVSPQSIALGGSATLTWSVTFPAGCTDIPLLLSGTKVGLSGSTTVQPMVDTTYALSVYTATLASTSVGVKLPPVVDIKGSGPDWRALLVKALGIDNTYVHLDDSVDMDMSGLSGVAIAGGVTLSTDPPDTHARLAAALPRPTGLVPPKVHARLFTRTRPTPLFAISGDNVRLHGFRLIGPDYDTMDGSAYEEVGVQFGGVVGIDIGHLEIAGWSGQGIRVIQYAAPFRNDKPEQVTIHDNYVHNNQHEGEDGYGVAVGPGAYALIEHNVFDFNRHAIFGDGRAGTGYRAHQNLVLKGGGIHAKWYKSHTHLFDVHGDDNCFPPGGSHTWNCGNAGDAFWISENAFQYTEEHAVKLRGKPRISARIDNNVFTQRAWGDAIELRTNDHVQVGTGRTANTYGYDSYGRYGVCDFDGDGKDDLFLATGVTWWYSSAGKMPWAFVATAPEKIDQVALGDFDNDGRCDVLTVQGKDWVVASGGNGPRRHYSGYDVPLDQVRFGHFPASTNVRDHRAGHARVVSDAFRRAPDGQWWTVAVGSQNWRKLASSSFPLNQLHLGDFDGDGATDILAVEGGHWSVSWGGSSGWQPLNAKLSDALGAVQIADVDGDGKDDVVRVSGGRVQASWGGRSDWVSLTAAPSDKALAVGRFEGGTAAGVLFADGNRIGQLYTKASGKVAPFSAFAY